MAHVRHGSTKMCRAWFQGWTVGIALIHKKLVPASLGLMVQGVVFRV